MDNEREDVTVLVAEELMLVREGLVRLCEATPGYTVVAQCSDGAKALQLIRERQPDIAVLDFNLPELFTLEVVRRLRIQGSQTRILVISTRRDRKTVLEALRCGASGYILKSGPASQFTEAFRLLEQGGVYVSPLLETNKIFNTPQKRVSGDPIENLSAREYQVFSLLIDGIRAKEIAARLDLSPKTVDTYRASLMRKLDIHDVAGLVKFAIQREFTTSRV
jgi:DNA-binding NarL/FixJ family response regulator